MQSNYASSIIGSRKIDLILILISVGLFAIFSLYSPYFFTTFNIVTLLISFSVLVLASLGGTFVIMTGSLDVSYSGLIALSGVVTALLLPSVGLFAILMGLSFGVFYGVLNGVVLAKARIPSFLVTLGTLYIAEGLANYLTPGGLSIYANQLGFLDQQILPTIPTLLIWAIVLTVVLYYFANYTRYGWRIFAVGSDDRRAALAGVSAAKTRILAFALSGGLASLAGILLISYIGAASGSTGTDLLFVSLAVIVLGGTSLSGGVGGPQRTFLGALIISIILNGFVVAGVAPGGVTAFEGITLILATAVLSRGTKLTVK